MKIDLTAERLREVLAFDPQTGLFMHLTPPRKKNSFPRLAGWFGGGINSRGYRIIRVDSDSHQAHRLAWLHVYGRWPEQHIDHINGDKADNRIANLRDVPRSVNLQNQQKERRSKSGVLGAQLVGNRYKAQISINGRQRCLGYFDTAEEAHAKYVEAKRLVHEGCTL